MFEDAPAAPPYAPDDRRDGVTGLAYAMRQVAQLLLMCDRHDIGISIDMEKGSGVVFGTDPAKTTPDPFSSPRIFVYDNYPGGIGFSEPLFRMHGELLDATRRLIAECPCENGCPGCVGPAGNTGPLAKVAALRILDLLSPGPQGSALPDGHDVERVLSDPAYSLSPLRHPGSA